MHIVCLAWGSLIWKPGVLPAGNWHSDGPTLPIEFARVGDKGEMATVLCTGAPFNTAFWARLEIDDLVQARRLLRQREEIREDRIGGVGTVVVGQPPAALLGASDILRWANAQDDVDAVIWTALPPRFAGTEDRIPTPSEAAAYVRGLRGEERRHAEDYVRQVPDVIRSPNRDALEMAIAA